MGFLDKLFGPKDWTTHSHEQGGFQIACPSDWTAREEEASLVLQPSTSGTVVDPESGLNLPAPGVRVSVRTLGEAPPDVKEMLRGRGTVYAEYRVLDHISGEVPGAEKAVVYEFSFASEGNAYRVVSAVALKGNRLFDLKGCVQAADFGSLQKTFRHVAKSFRLI